MPYIIQSPDANFEFTHNKGRCGGPHAISVDGKPLLTMLDCSVNGISDSDLRAKSSRLYHKAGQTIFDSQLVREMFRPGNSEVIKNLVADRNNFLVIRLFFYIAVPIFVLVRFAVENFARKQYKDVKKNRSFRIGRRLMLASGFVLILHAILAAIETFTNTGSMVNISSNFAQMQGISAAVNTAFVIMHLAIGYIGYKLWKDPTKKMIKIAFVSAAVLLVLTVIATVLSNSLLSSSNDPLIVFDSAVILIITVTYITGAIIVRAKYDLGLEKPRDK